MDIDARVDSLYKLARNYPDNRELQEAVAVIKSLRSSQGQYKRWPSPPPIPKAVSSATPS